MSPAAIKQTLALYAGQVYWFAPGFSTKRLACQLWPMSSLFLLDVYGYFLWNRTKICFKFGEKVWGKICFKFQIHLHQDGGQGWGGQSLLGRGSRGRRFPLPVKSHIQRGESPAFYKDLSANPFVNFWMICEQLNTDNDSIEFVAIGTYRDSINVG